jgi:hypothetical protein
MTAKKKNAFKRKYAKPKKIKQRVRKPKTSMLKARKKCTPRKTSPTTRKVKTITKKIMKKNPIKKLRKRK